MKTLTLLLTILVSITCLSQSIIPLPSSVTLASGTQSINSSNTIFYSDSEFENIAKLLQTEIQRCHGINLNTALGNTTGAGDIIIQKNTSLKEEQYTLEVDNAIVVEAKGISGAYPGTVSIVQALKSESGEAVIQKMSINDEPYKEFRAVMIDVKNHWYSPSNIKRFIKLARFYKIRYLSLHTGEKQWIGAVLDQTTNYTEEQRMRDYIYTKAEIDDLIQFGKQNGVYLFPHSECTPSYNQMKEAMQKDFNPDDTFDGYADEIDGLGSFADFDGEENNTRFRNVVSEAHRRVIDQFKAGYPEGIKMPMYHIGPVQSEGGMSDNLANYFRSEINAKDADLKMSYWAGPNTRSSALNDHKDKLIPICYTKQFHPSFADHLNNNWQIVNAAWTPLYIVGSSIARPVDWVYNEWNYFRGGTDGLDGNPITYDLFSGIRDENVVGGLMCTWENEANLNYIYLRDRLPAYSEHAWQHKTWPYPTADFKSFESRLAVTKKIGDLFVSTSEAPKAPESVAATDNLFSNKVRITWNVADNGPTSYTLYRNNSDNSNTATVVTTLDGDAISYEDTTVTNGITYYYWLKARNNFGESDFSTPNTGSSSNTGSGLVNSYEPFDYETGQSTVNKTGGNGWRTSWSLDGANGTTTINDFGLNYPNLETSGKSVKFKPDSDTPSLVISRETTGQIGSEGISTWVSYLIRANKVGSGHVALFPNAEFLLGLAKSFGSKLINTTMEANQTYLIVYQFESSPGNDVARYWLNPDLAVIPSPSNVSSLKLDKDIRTGNKITINIQGYGRGDYDIDEIRVGTTFREVMPPIDKSVLNVSVPELSLTVKNSIIISPNPIKNQLNIKTKETANFIEATLFNLKGELISKGLFNGKKELNLTNLQSLSSGVYLLKVSGKNGFVTKKLIKK